MVLIFLLVELDNICCKNQPLKMKGSGATIILIFIWQLRWDESVKGLAFASTCADLAPRIEDRATHAVTEKMLGTKESTFPRTQDCILLRILPSIQ